MALPLRSDVHSHPLDSRDWPPQGEWTYDDYARLPDDGWRYEVIRGVLLMSPAPRPQHQRTLKELFKAMEGFVEEHGLGEIFLSPIDVILGDLATPVQPDLVFVSRQSADIVSDRAIEGPPDLVVEVLSPSSWLTDRREKLQLYAEAGIREYWIADPGERTLEVFVLERDAYAVLGSFGRDETARSRVLDGFEVEVARVFSAPAGGG